MRIINCMFGKKLGGIEQVFIDYCSALAQQGNQVMPLIRPGAAIYDKLLPAFQQNTKQIANKGKWDLFAIVRLRRLMKQYKPDALICHGNRAISLMSIAAKNIAPVIGLAHNYSIKPLSRTDAAFTISQDLHDYVIKHTIHDASSCYHIPNMIAVAEQPEIRQPHSNQTIMTLGRFVKKKGFKEFIDAIALVYKKNPHIRIIIAGDGEEKACLQEYTAQSGLAEIIQFPGWVDKTEQLFKQADIFCLPSLHEPFGIVILEAFNTGIPVISTDTEGPSEIITHEQNGLIVPKNNPQAMADAILRLLNDHELEISLAKDGYKTVKSHYGIRTIGEKIQHAITDIVQHYR